MKNYVCLDNIFDMSWFIKKDTDPKQDSDLDTNQKQKSRTRNLRIRLANYCSVQTSLLYYMNLTVKTIVADPDPHSIWSAGSGSALGIRIRIQEGQNYPQKWKKFMFWSARCSLLRDDEDFCCSLDVLYGGLGISKLQFLIKKIFFLFSCKFFQICGHQNPGSGSALKPLLVRNTDKNNPTSKKKRAGELPEMSVERPDLSSYSAHSSSVRSTSVNWVPVSRPSPSPSSSSSSLYPRTCTPRKVSILLCYFNYVYFYVKIHLFRDF